MSADRIDDGGPAFPQEDNGSCAFRPGLSIRDYFAAQALPECIAREMGPSGAYQHFCGSADAIIARCAYGIADAMLHARQQQ